MTMKAADKKKWVAALRSGEYKQGQRRLCKTVNGKDLFCCLGVAADVLLDTDWVQGFHFGVQHSVQEWGIGGRFGLIAEEIGITHAQASRLAGMNDRRHSFAYIADVIEKDPTI